MRIMYHLVMNKYGYNPLLVSFLGGEIDCVLGGGGEHMESKD